MRSVEMKNRCLLYYGNPVGYRTEQGVVADSMFRREELEDWLARKGLAVRWEDGIYDRLSSGGYQKAADNGPALKSCRIWQLGPSAPAAMRFIGLDRMSGEYGGPDLKKYQKEYPLMEWGWSRKDCIQAIRDAGLPLPGKSSCFFCPSMKRWEIRTLYHRYPDLLRRALAIEDAAMPNLTSVRGLGRNWAWRDFICADENQLAIPGAFSDEDLPCSCCMKGELPTADL